MQTHYALRSLNAEEKPDKDVEALFAVQPSDKAVLFIHGYSGDAVETWSQFDELLPARPNFQARDIYFYGYDGLRAEMNASASLFRDFLSRLFANTAGLVNASLSATARRPPGFQYSELLIIAHSLGAVIARRALLDATTRLHEPWVSRVKLLLFAPAHRGASVAKLALEVTTSFSFLSVFGVGARFASPLIDQLMPDSDELERLRDETAKACQNGANPHLRALKVIIAEYENIVKNETFCDDPPPITIPDTNHKTVCKPRQGFLRPLSYVDECV